jgi:hypothetical protein
MTISNLIKKKPLYLLTISLFILFSCTSGSEKTSEQHENKQNFQVPKLVQQEIVVGNSNDYEEYDLYNRIREEGPVIPGIFQATVPQGMAYYPDEDLMLISNYMFDGRPSCITAISMTDGLLKKTLWLLNPDNSPHMGHVGGLAVSKKYLWIASGKGVYYVSLESFENRSDNTNLKMTAFVQTAAKGSFATFSDGILWIGEFTSRDGSYSVPDFHHFKNHEGNVNHGWMAGFILDSESEMINQENIVTGISYPDYILSIPHEVQGAAFIKGRIILSQSYGRKNNSRISVYLDPLEELPHSFFITDDNRSIPVWILDDQNLEVEIIAPPMTEGIVNYKGFTAILYESGSDKYRNTAKNPQDRISILNL